MSASKNPSLEVAGLISAPFETFNIPARSVGDWRNHDLQPDRREGPLSRPAKATFQRKAVVQGA